MNTLTLTMSVELAPRVRVNGIAPGVVPTEVMMTGLDMDVPALEKMAEARIPLKRLGTPDDMAAAAIYLASHAGSWVTGQIPHGVRRALEHAAVPVTTRSQSRAEPHVAQGHAVHHLPDQPARRHDPVAVEHRGGRTKPSVA